MREDVKEANAVMCRCKSTRKPYGIRIERRINNTWYLTWAFILSERAGSNEGYGSTMISGRVEVDPEYPGCPYCGGGGWVSCGKCGKLTCYDGVANHFTCAWCGSSGKIQMAESFDLKGGGY